MADASLPRCSPGLSDTPVPQVYRKGMEGKHFRFKERPYHSSRLWKWKQIHSRCIEMIKAIDILPNEHWWIFWNLWPPGSKPSNLASPWPQADYIVLCSQSVQQKSVHDFEQRKFLFPPPPPPPPHCGVKRSRRSWAPLSCIFGFCLTTCCRISCNLLFFLLLLLLSCSPSPL